MKPQESSEPLVGSDLILLLLSAPAKNARALDRIDGITRLEKLLFLAEEESHLSERVQSAFQFRPYDLGPYSKEIYEAVELLEELDLLHEERVYEGSALDEEEEIAAALDKREGIERRFYLTDKGKAVAGFLASQHSDVANALSEIKDRYGRMPLRQLIRYVYTRYPRMAEFSKIRDEVLGS